MVCRIFTRLCIFVVPNLIGSLFENLENNIFAYHVRHEGYRPDPLSEGGIHSVVLGRTQCIFLKKDHYPPLLT